jgi:hypothetical protein
MMRRDTPACDQACILVARIFLRKQFAVLAVVGTGAMVVVGWIVGRLAHRRNLEGEARRINFEPSDLSLAPGRALARPGLFVFEVVRSRW